jgi:hypothetical protein
VETYFRTLKHCYHKGNKKYRIYLKVIDGISLQAVIDGYGRIKRKLSGSIWEAAKVVIKIYKGRGRNEESKYVQKINIYNDRRSLNFNKSIK